jgi:amino acid permease
VVSRAVEIMVAVQRAGVPLGAIVCAAIFACIALHFAGQPTARRTVRTVVQTYPSMQFFITCYHARSVLTMC